MLPESWILKYLPDWFKVISVSLSAVPVKWKSPTPVWLIVADNPCELNGLSDTNTWKSVNLAAQQSVLFQILTVDKSKTLPRSISHHAFCSELVCVIDWAEPTPSLFPSTALPELKSLAWGKVEDCVVVFPRATFCGLEQSIGSVGLVWIITSPTSIPILNL